MRAVFRKCLILFPLLLIQMHSNEGQETNKPQLPVSVLDELLRANGTNGGTGGSDALNTILGSLVPIMGSDNSGNPSNSDNSDNSTGIGVVDFFRNLIAMFLRAVLQVFKFFQLLSRTISGNDTKKLGFLSMDGTIDLEDNEISDNNNNNNNNNEKLERVLRQIQLSANEFPLNSFISNEKAQEFEDQIKEAFKVLPNFDGKSMADILKSDSFKANFKSGLKSIYRHKRQNRAQFEDNYNEMSVALDSLVNQFVDIHSLLNNDFHFEFPKKSE